ncbi:hypothetical protein ACFPK9_03395 [Rubritalea spongiae]|uniref:Uncharacterized protein n=1 Tax=Rubritalea spongiae TaxID=430797 RepID=A0ABW5E5S6_9BACT
MCSISSAKDLNPPVTFHWKSQDNTIDIIITEENFTKENHTYLKQNGNPVSQIDGMRPWGTEGVLPTRELTKFQLTWDGKKMTIPKNLWADCFNLNLFPYSEPEFPEPGNYPFVKLTEDRQYIIFTFHGADASFAYAVTWILAKDGTHSRWISGA